MSILDDRVIEDDTSTFCIFRYSPKSSLQLKDKYVNTSESSEILGIAHNSPSPAKILMNSTL
jgi:hypothetical protein